MRVHNTHVRTPNNTKHSNNTDAALDMGARLLPGGRGIGFKVWAPHASSVNVEMKKATATNVDETLALVKGGENVWYG